MSEKIKNDTRLRPLDSETTLQFGKDSFAVRDGRFITEADFSAICREQGIAEGDVAHFTDFFDLLLVEPVIWGGEHGYMVYV